jgi:hypothetical protein
MSDLVEYPEASAFPGVIGRTVQESSPEWPGPNFTEAARHGRAFGTPVTPAILEELDRTGWELYDMAADPTEFPHTTHEAEMRRLLARQ